MGCAVAEQLPEVWALRAHDSRGPELEIPDVAWGRPQYSVSHVRRAGSILRATDPDGTVYPDEWDEALAVVGNWRACHGLPLQVINMTLRVRANTIARRSRTKALVTQRLKRLESMWRKLRIEKTMSLVTMQDIGGCRAVMRSMREVDALTSIYDDQIAKGDREHRPVFVEKYDYLEGEPGPKATGYRGMHYVFKYRGGSEKHECYHGRRIEIQIRSQLQHAWATAVEAVDTLTKQALKSNIGSDDWKRFFALMGSVIARRERGVLIPGTPTRRKALSEELLHYAEGLHIYDVLNGYGLAVFEMTKEDKGASFFLLRLDPVEREINVQAYLERDLPEAEAAYIEVEKGLDRARGQQAVLVRAESISSLRRAYPNYFLDTRAFLNVLARAVRNANRDQLSLPGFSS